MTKGKKRKDLNISSYPIITMVKKGSSDIDNSNFDEIEPEYKKLIDLACDRGLDFDISNSSLNHAKYVINKLIKTTIRDINIFSSKLDNELFCDPRIINTIKNNNTRSIRFLLSNPKDNETNCFKKLVGDKDIKIKNIENKKNTPYFIVSDNKRIRIESNFDPNKAKVNFNNVPIALHLNKIFEELWGSNPKKIV